MTKTSKEEALNKYIKEKHTQEECIGFIDGWEASEKRVEELEEDNKRLMGLFPECWNMAIKCQTGKTTLEWEDFCKINNIE